MSLTSRLKRLGMSLPVAAATLAALAPAAQAGFGVSEFDGLLTADGEGTVQTQAGGHPFDYKTTIKFNDLPNEVRPGFRFPDEQVKDTTVSLPPGLVGNPTAVPTCPESDLATFAFSGGNCLPDTQIGYVVVKTGHTALRTMEIGVYNQKPSPGYAATFGFSAPSGTGTTHIQAKLRTGGDYGIEVEAADIPQTLPILSIELVIWGVPADPVHNPWRGKGYLCLVSEVAGKFCPRPGGSPSGADVRPYLTMPTACEGPQTTSLRTDSWLHPGVFKGASFVSHDQEGNQIGMEGCEEVPFTPNFTFRPGSTVAGQPTSYSADLHLPYLDNPGGVAQAGLRDVRIELPEGVTVSSASANGLGSCGPAQIDLNGPNAANCPADSKIGSVELGTPVVDHPLRGSLYLASQGTNPFNSLLAMYLTIDDPATGIAIKLAGKVSPDPQTGQLVVNFDRNPQLPFEDLHMELKGGARAPLVNPAACGTYTTHAEFASWARPNLPVSSDSSFTIDQGCGNASKFTPGFSAGTTNPVGGDYSPFTLRVTRPDGQQNVASIQATLPEGVLAKLAGVPLCGDAEASSGNCPAGSQVGTAVAGVGAGSNPLEVPQPGKPSIAVYLAGPYKGGPYSLVAKVPAQAGPFDLGTVAVRNAINVDPATAQVSVKSDPLPQILQGIPIAYRDIKVDVNRDRFTINPTSCDPMKIEGAIGSAGGQSADVSDRFQVANCANLAFKPKLSLRLSGAPPRRGGYPKLTATLRMPDGGANTEKAVVTMPKTQFLENAHIRTICTRVQYAAGKGGGEACPPASVYGYAKAWTPLLDEPLQGPVYLRSSSNKLPDLVASLDGAIHVDLVGRIDSPNARIRNTFASVPDAPVSKFVLTMQGGRKGLLVNNTNLCKAKPRASVRFDGQNGKIGDSNPLVKVGGCGKAKKRRK